MTQSSAPPPGWAYPTVGRIVLLAGVAQVAYSLGCALLIFDGSAFILRRRGCQLHGLRLPLAESGGRILLHRRW